MTQTNNEREAFEKWYQSQFTGKVDFKRYSGNSIYYDNDDIDTSWEAWEARAQSPISQNEQQCAVTNLWEALGKWSAYLASNGEQANLAPPSWLIDAVSSATSPPKQIPDEWVADPDTIPSQLIEITRQAICLEFGDSGTDGYYKRILAKIFKAMLNASPTTSLTSETNTEVGE